MMVDLHELEQDVRYRHNEDIATLIRVARAAKALAASGEYEGESEWGELRAALSDIEDSKP